MSSPEHPSNRRAPPASRAGSDRDTATASPVRAEALRRLPADTKRATVLRARQAAVLHIGVHLHATSAGTDAEVSCACSSCPTSKPCPPRPTTPG